MNRKQIDERIFDDDYDSDHLSWADDSGATSDGFNNSDSSHQSDHDSQDSISGESDNSDLGVGGSFSSFAGIRRRLSGPQRNNYNNDQVGDVEHYSDDTDNSKVSRGKRIRPTFIFPEAFCQRCSRFFTGPSISSIALLSCCVIWICVKAFSINTELDAKVTKRQTTFLTPEQMNQVRDQKRKDAERALGSAAGKLHKARHRVGWSTASEDGKRGRGVVTDNKEALSHGCIPSDWHKLSFPTCNLLHEVDVRETIFGVSNIISPFVGGGLWRDVFMINDNSGAKGVLKMMKGEHDIDSRNFDRHRRDALVMERLTPSPFVVSMFAFCGNTVLTEFAGKGLDIVLQNNSSHYPSRNSPRFRLKLATDVAKSIQVLHEIEGGPIVHTDLQSEQFLVDETGRVKVNDFNRCRFVAHSNQTGKACPFRIPTAPGAYRSPEEYEELGLSEKLDIYSTANVLYHILTGHEAWYKDTIAKVKVHVTNGENPPVLDEYLRPGSIDAGLAAIIRLGHEHSPSQRISAAEMVATLDKLQRVHS